MSIYTYHFLEALQGAGNQPCDKAVKISNLMNYVSKTVPASTQQHYQKEQTPFFDFATNVVIKIDKARDIQFRDISSGKG